MSDYPQYNPSVEMQVGSGDSPMAQSDEERANLYGKLAQKSFGMAQQSVNQKEAQEGQQDASKQGLAWSPKSNLTEAGRAYNRAGQPLSDRIASSQIIGRVSQAYNEQMNQPISDDPKYGNLAKFNTAVTKYYNQASQTIDPKMKPYMDQIFESARTSYGSRIANRVGTYQRSQASADALNNYNQLSNQASNLMTQSWMVPKGSGRDQSQKTSYDIYQSAQQVADHLATISGDPMKAAELKRTNAVNFLNSSIYGRMQGLIQRYNDADDKDKPIIASEIQKYPENFDTDASMQKVYGQVSLNDNMSALDREKVTRTLNRMSSQIGKSISADASQMKVNMANNLVAVNNTGHIDANFMSTVPAKIFPAYNDKVQAASVAYKYYQDYTSRGLSSVQGFIDENSDPHKTFTIPGLDANASQMVKTQLLSQFNSYKKYINNDPYSSISNTQPAQSYISNTASKLQSNDPKVSNGQLQTEFHNSINDPMTNFTSLRSPQVSESLNDANTHLLQLQNSHGIDGQHQTLISADQAKNIVNDLNAKDPIDRIQAITTAQQNYGNNWGAVQRALIHAKLPYQDLLSAQIMRNTKDSSLITDMANGQDMIKQNSSKVFSDLAYDGNKLSYSTARQDIINNLPSDLISNLNKNPGSATSNMLNGLVDTIIDTSVSRLNKAGKKWDAPSSGMPFFGSNNTTKQAINDVLNGLYQKGAQDGIRVPYQIMNKNPSGGYTQSPINYDTVKNMMAYYKNKAPEQANLENNIDVKKAIYNSKWVNTPSGNGLMLVQSNGKPFYFKNKKPYAFSFNTAANPGSLPSDYQEYVHNNIVSRAYHDIG